MARDEIEDVWLTYRFPSCKEVYVITKLIWKWKRKLNFISFLVLDYISFQLDWVIFFVYI